jgi:hypothetical protein
MPFAAALQFDAALQVVAALQLIVALQLDAAFSFVSSREGFRCSASALPAGEEVG